MGDKVYRPIIKEGDHLVKSKDNPDRVRGLTRDKNNQNPDIPEWEEVDVDDLERSNDITYQDRELTPEQQQMMETIATALALIVIETGKTVFQKVIKPWWINRVQPWIKKKIKASKQQKAEARQSDLFASTNKASTTDLSNPRFEEVSIQIDQLFDKMHFEMDEKEASEHIMQLILHMLGVVNEIRILSNASIRKNSDSDSSYIENVHEAEQFLSEKVAKCLDQMLVDPRIKLDLNTSRELFSLTGGGVYINGEYSPVQPKRIEEVLLEMPVNT